MDIYVVDMITDMDEPIRVEVQAYDQAEAEAISLSRIFHSSPIW